MRRAFGAKWGVRGACGLVAVATARLACESASRPPNAILPDTEKGLEQWLELNRSLSSDWPNITRKKPFPEDADDFKDVTDKYDKYFSPNPGGR